MPATNPLSQTRLKRASKETLAEWFCILNLYKTPRALSPDGDIFSEEECIELLNLIGSHVPDDILNEKWATRESWLEGKWVIPSDK